MVLTLTWWPRRRRRNSASTTERTISNSQLSDAQWFLIADLFPEKEMTRVGGRPPIAARPCLEGILWVLRSGARWKDLPRDFPSYVTCWRRFHEWTHSGLWRCAWGRLVNQLDELRQIDWRVLLADGSFCRAKKGVLRSASAARAKVPRFCCSPTGTISRWRRTSPAPTSTR